MTMPDPMTPALGSPEPNWQITSVVFGQPRFATEAMEQHATNCPLLRREGSRCPSCRHVLALVKRVRELESQLKPSIYVDPTR